MSGRSFLDTNVFIYADDADAPEAKRASAQAAIADAFTRGSGVISTQVLQEFFAVATRKLGLSAESAQRRVELYAQLPVVVVDSEHIVAAIRLHRLYAVSFWDALIVRAALASRCSRLLTEDLQTGQQIEGIEVVDPFA